MSDLRRTLEELASLAARSNVDLAAELAAVARKIDAAPPREDAWRRVELARNPDRSISATARWAAFGCASRMAG